MGYTHTESPRVFNALGFLWQMEGLQPVTATGSPHKSHEELIANINISYVRLLCNRTNVFFADNVGIRLPPSQLKRCASVSAYEPAVSGLPWLPK